MPFSSSTHGEIFAGALFLHQGVLVAAGLGAGAPVGVPTRHIIGEQAAAGVGHAHGPVGRRSPAPAPAVFWRRISRISVQCSAPGPARPACAPRSYHAWAAGVVGDGALGARCGARSGAHNAPPCVNAPRSARIRASTPAVVQPLADEPAGGHPPRRCGAWY